MTHLPVSPNKTTLHLLPKLSCLLFIMLSIIGCAIHVFTLINFALAEDCSERDSDHYEQNGQYKHKGITSYEDFLIRNELDADADLINMRPYLALRKIEKTMNKYPKR